LTGRERDIVSRLIERPTISNQEIADSLGISIKTLENLMTILYKRMGIGGDSCQRRIALILTFL
jgi:DNA-binding CsgD family transcriptional regulator